jgi:hypothetical protein
MMFRAMSAIGRGALLVALKIRERTPATRVGASDRRTRPIGDRLELRVLWIDRPGQVGPSYSVFAAQHELVRVDLLDDGAHFHPAYSLLLASNSSDCRSRVAGDTRAERIANGVADFRYNLAYATGTHPSPRVRSIAVSDAELDAAALWLDEQLQELVRTHPA